jgi:hypothetical protein
VSIEASSFVLGLSMGQGNGIRKLILLGYANHADKHGRGAYPSTRTIADYAECDVRTVQRHLRWLTERGYLHEGDQQMVDHLDPRYRPIVYDVAMTAEQIEQWASGTGPDSGNRARAAQAGRRGGRASSQVSRGDKNNGLGVTDRAVRGDNRVTRTVQEPSLEPSSSPPAPGHAPAAVAGGGIDVGIIADVLDVLPEPVRDHPSIVPSAIARRVQTLDQRGWPRPQIRERLTGIETADKPGAAALTRLDNLAALAPPQPRPTRPQWCGHCDERTRLRESPHNDRPYRCPNCHPQTTPRPTNQAERQRTTGSTSADRP